MSVSHDRCPFCDLSNRQVLYRNNFAFAIRDAYPVSVGHALVIPDRHVADLFELPDHEIRAVFEAVREAKTLLTTEFSPTAFNVGINIGRDAGQTVMHAHVHVIPRYVGDVDDPTGGIRNVIPGKGRYQCD